MSTGALPRGVDVASYQGYPAWHRVASAGYAFAFTKATEDTGYINPTFAHNWAGIKAAGMHRGAYHFARPGGFDAADEARYFLDAVGAVGGLETGDLLALDIESGNGDMGRWALDFLRVCEARCGFKPLVYTGRWFMQGRSFDEPELAGYGLWLAAYQAQMPSPPAPWEVVAFWQHSSSGRVPGIDGDVDLNVFNGAADRIALYGKPASDPPPPEPSRDTRIARARALLEQAIGVLDEPAPA